MRARITSADSTREKLIGAWTLLLWSTQDSDGAVSYPPGQDAVTQLSYDDSGSMSAQLMRQNQQPFSSRDWRKADADEKAKAWGDYFGYFGRYELNEAGHAVIHHIEDSWFGPLSLWHNRLTGVRLIMSIDSNRREIAREAKAIVALAFRNGPIEDLHAGRACPTCTGSDGYSRITDDEMKRIMKHAVDHVYHLLLLKEEDPFEYESKISFGERYTAKWDDPEKPKRSRNGLAW